MQVFPLVCLLIGFAVTAQTGNIDDLLNDSSSKNSFPDAGGAGEACTCAAFYLCNKGTVDANGERLIDIRKDHRDPCGSVIEVCCDKKDQLDNPVTPAPIKTEGCGYRNDAGIGFKILGDGNEAQYGEFPWMVAIFRKESNEEPVYHCGGSLIHPKVVITTASCVTGKNQKFIARVGEWDTQTTKELYPYQDREVASVVTHPQFNAGKSYNDIAILFLESPVELGRTVNVICLPPKNTVFHDSSCVTTGWNKENYGTKRMFSVILKKIELPIVDRDKCETELRKTRAGKLFKLHSSSICAGGEKEQNTCDGEIGSPLVCPIKDHQDRYVHSGIVSWLPNCGVGNVPGMYTNVALFKDWIDEQLTSNDIHERPYEY